MRAVKYIRFGPTLFLRVFWVEFEYCMSGVDPTLFLRGLALVFFLVRGRGLLVL